MFFKLPNLNKKINTFFHKLIKKKKKKEKKRKKEKKKKILHKLLKWKTKKYHTVRRIPNLIEKQKNTTLSEEFQI